MTLGVIGVSDDLRALAARLQSGSPFSYGSLPPRFWAPSPAEDETDEVRYLAEKTSARFLASWQTLLAESSLTAVLCSGPLHTRAVQVEAALARGLSVLCPLPLTLDEAVLTRLEEAQDRGNGWLLAPGAFFADAATRDALRAVEDGRLGDLHAIYGAAHLPLQAAADDERFTAAVCDLLDTALRAAPAPLQQVYACASAEAAPLRSLLITMRFQGGLIASLQVAACLSGSSTAASCFELDLEGEQGAIRLEPQARSLTVTSSVFGPARVPLQEVPLVPMLEEFTESVRRSSPQDGALAHQRRLVQCLGAIERSLTLGDAIIVS